jgi:hypothetical protein
MACGVVGVALTSKPNPPIAPRAKRLASVINKQDIRDNDQTNGEDRYGYGYDDQDRGGRNPCAHMASDIQQRRDPKEAQCEDHGALQEVR